MHSQLLAYTTWALGVGHALAAVQYGGVNLAGFDFGCSIDGRCDVSKVVAPLHQYKGQDGAAQMQHFVKDDGLNAFRLPVGWQFLVDEPGAPLNAGNMEQYDALVQACLATGSLCVIDIHNYARWDGLIIGQGGPSDEQFANLWSQLATKYAQSPKVAMGIVNEPHEVPSITRWAQTCQTVVDAIRKAGATEHYIMLPGNGYTSAASFVSSGSAAALLRVKDSDGSTDKLIFEVHKYLDSDNSGTHKECVSSYVDQFDDLTNFLKTNNRKAILAETGGGPDDPSCLKDVCELLSYLNDNSDSYMGYLGWGAGSFDSSYELYLTPEEGSMKDVPLMTQCFAKLFSGSGGSPPLSSGPGDSSSSSGSGGSSSSSGSGGSSSSSGGSSGGSSSGGGAMPPIPSQTYSSPPFPIPSSNGTSPSTGGMPMPTGGLPGGQGGTQTGEGRQVSNPGGSNPGSSNPGGSNPGGSNPGGSNQSGQITSDNFSSPSSMPALDSSSPSPTTFITSTRSSSSAPQNTGDNFSLPGSTSLDASALNDGSGVGSGSGNDAANNRGAALWGSKSAKGKVGGGNGGNGSGGEMTGMTGSLGGSSTETETGGEEDECEGE